MSILIKAMIIFWEILKKLIMQLEKFDVQYQILTEYRDLIKELAS